MSTTGIIEGDLERTSKYTKKWAKRYVRFEEATRRISYGVNKDASPKSTMVCTKITRFAELVQPRPHTQDLYAVQVEGTSDDGRHDLWTLRMPDAAVFERWYSTVRNALAAQGQMDPLNYGLPEDDPRNGLTFASVPLEYLHKFALLEKAILYYFGCVTMHGYENAAAGSGLQDHIIAVGDRNLYIFRPNADVLRCVAIENLTGMHTPKDPNHPGAFCVLLVQPSEHDIVLRNTNDGQRICEILNDVYRGIKGKALPMAASCDGPVEQYVEKHSLKLRPLDGYKMKAMSPTPKSKLKIALDLYIQQHGTTYSRTGKPKAGAGKAGSGVGGDGGAASAGGGAAGASAATSAVEDDTIDDALSRMLSRLQLRQYIPGLRKQHVDVDLLSCMDAADLTNFGVNNAVHATAIVKAAQEREANGSPVDAPFTPPSAAAAVTSSPAAAASPTGTRSNVVITLDSDDEDLMPIRRDTVFPTGGAPDDLPITPAVVTLSDSDDELVVRPPPAAPANPTAAVILDEDDI